MREIFIFEKRQATGKEKATLILYNPTENKFIKPRFIGIDEAESRLKGLTVYPCIYCTTKSYIPVRFRRDEDKYIIIKKYKK